MRALSIVIVLLIASLAYADQEAEEPRCWWEVSVHKRGETFGPFPGLQGARYAMPGVTNCNGWTEEELGGDSAGLADTRASISTHIETTPSGGCEIVVDRMRCVVTPIDLEHDPRVHRFPPIE